jgi:hypothetical protein
MPWPITQNHPRQDKPVALLPKKKKRIVPCSGNSQLERFVNGVDFIIVPMAEWEEDNENLARSTTAARMPIPDMSRTVTKNGM